MGVRYYDEALYNKIQSWVRDKRMRILKPDESARLFKIVADTENDKPVTLPLISLVRETDFEIKNPNKKPMTFDGYKIGKTDAGAVKLNAIPIELAYRIEIYTKEYEVADEYCKNFIFNLVNHPKVTIEIPYNGVNYEHESNIQVKSTVQDNSDIPQRIFSGQFSRWTISFTIDDAYLFSAPAKDNVYICADESDVELVEG